MYINTVMIKRKILHLLEKELESDRIIVLTGMRRTGKTTLIKYLYEKTSSSRKLYLDLENPLNQAYFSEVDFDKVKVNLEQLAIGREKRLVVFLDEIQNVKNITSVEKYLSEHNQIKFILTGSASFYLKNLFVESLSGRKRVFELYPLDFGEFLSFKWPGVKKPVLTDTIDELTFLGLQKYYQEYLTYGGFPSVVLKPTHEEKTAEIADIFTSYFQKEIQLLSDFRKLDAMRSVILLLLERSGGKLDLTKISQEIGTSRITVGQYVDFLEWTYFLKRINPYSKNLDVTLRGQPKIYICDNGFLGQVKVTNGVLLENNIFNLLQSQFDKIYFYQTKAKAEIDFIVEKDQKILALEVKTQAVAGDVKRLERLSQRLKIDQFYVVSQKYCRLPKVIYPFQL